MKHDDLVPMLDTCRALQEAGFDAVTAFQWRRDFDDPWTVTLNEGAQKSGWLRVTSKQGNDLGILHEWVAAPTLAELLAELPLRPSPQHSLHMRRDDTPSGRDYTFGYYHRSHLLADAEPVSTNPAEAAARLWLALRASGRLAKPRPHAA